MSKQKINSAQFDMKELYASALDVPQDIKSEIEDQGFVCRWINATEFQKQYGFHKSRWVPYKRKDKKANAGLLGGDPEGFIRRGDLVLAVKPRQEQELHAARIQHKTKINTMGAAKAAEELRNSARQHGVNARIDDKYEHTEEEEADEE